MNQLGLPTMNRIGFRLQVRPSCSTTTGSTTRRVAGDA